MKRNSTQDPTAQLVDHLTDQLSGDPAWVRVTDRLNSGAVSLHLAVLLEPFLGLLMDGTKTIESRFSRVRCAPYGCLNEGDVVAVKKAGGPVVGAFIAGPVTSCRLTGHRLDELRELYSAQICATGQEFWAERADCTYATLVEVTHIRSLPAVAFPKKDRRGWVRLLPTERENGR